MELSLSNMSVTIRSDMKQLLNLNYYCFYDAIKDISQAVTVEKKQNGDFSISNSKSIFDTSAVDIQQYNYSTTVP